MAMMVKPCSLASAVSRGELENPIQKYGEFIAKCWVLWGESMVLFPVNVAVIKSEKSWLTQCCIFQQATFGYQRLVGLKNN
jgi:hypothetical protein